VTRYKSVLVAISLNIVMAGSGVAQQAPSTPRALPNDTCAGCFAYLEFSASLEPESYAMRGQATEASIALPAAGDPDGPLREQTAVLAVTANR
jgi:hypothetical protein